MHSTAEAFRQAIERAGLTPPSRIEGDGKIHRFSTNGTRGDDSGWYILHHDGLPAGAFGDWRTGLRENFSPKPEREMTASERAAYTKRLNSIKRQREIEERRRQAEAAAKARRIWEAAKPAPEDHPYFRRKQVSSHGLRLSRDGRLIVPLRDLSGAICSLEFIDSAGEKRFLSGGVKRGRAFIFGDAKGADAIYVTEGWATGASVYEATGRTTAVAFDKGNLLPVVKAIRSKWQDSRIVICGDNDVSGVGQQAAQEAAEAVGGRVAIPARTGDDWNDVHGRAGLDAVKAGINTALNLDASISCEAGDVEPISLEPIELPTLPTSCIPVPWLRDMIEAVAAMTETPPELACLLSLAVVATATQRQYCVELSRSHTEQLSLWACAALLSGERKSPVLKIMTRPLLDFERRQSAALSGAMQEADAARQLSDEKIKFLRHKAARASGADADALRQALQKEAASAPEVPCEPRYWTQDTTPEELAALLADHGGAMAILCDEAGIFDILAGRYSNGIPNLDLVLQAYSGMPVRVDRRSRVSTYLASPKLTICVTPQPSVLQGLARQPSFRGRGLLSRFYYAVPRSKVGSRELVDQPIPEAVEARYDAAITTLLDKSVLGSDLRRLTFARDAYAEWKDYQRHMETEMRPGGGFEHLTDWGSKCPGGAARIAGILHCAKHAHGEPADHPVDLETTTAALTLSSVFERHAVVAFGMMGADATVESAKRVWAWIHQGRHRTFSRRDVFNGLRGQFPTVEALRPALLSLEERGYIFVIAEEKRAGRPTHRFRVNARLARAWE